MTQKRIARISDIMRTSTLFFSAHAPLFLIMAIRFRCTWIMWLSIGAMTVSIISLIAIFVGLYSTEGTLLRITRTRPAGAEAAAYLGTYILPFIAIPSPDIWDMVTYGVFFVVAGAIYARTSVILINPMLFLAGFRILEFDDSKVSSGFLVTRSDVKVGDKVSASRYSSDVWLAKKVHH